MQGNAQVMFIDILGVTSGTKVTCSASPPAPYYALVVLQLSWRGEKNRRQRTALENPDWFDSKINGD